MKTHCNRVGSKGLCSSDHVKSDMLDRTLVGRSDLADVRRLQAESIRLPPLGEGLLLSLSTPESPCEGSFCALNGDKVRTTSPVHPAA